MFEVDWTDYNNERVGQRRARKEIEKKRDDARSAHDSVITRSSSSSGDRHFGILESIGLKKTNASPKTKKPASLALRTARNDERQRNSVCAPESSRVVVHDSCISSSEETSPKSAPAVTGNFSQSRLPIPWKSTTDHWPHDLLSPNPLDIAVPASTRHSSGVAADSAPVSAKVIQSLGSDSYITKTTELTYEPRKETDTNSATTGISIGAHQKMPASLAPAITLASPVAESKDMSVSVMIDRWFTAVHSPSSSPGLAFGEDIIRYATSLPPTSRQRRQSPTGTPTHSPRKKLFALTPPSRRAKISSAGNPDAWKPPDAWNCHSTPDKPTPRSRSLRRLSDNPDEAFNMSLDLEAMKKEIKNMAVACPQSILVKLNEQWGTAPDAGFYKRLELERKRWMLSALNSMHDRDQGSENIDNTPPDSQKILALFESQSTTAYLAAFYDEATITHLAPSPLSHILFPNVQPLFSTINTALPLAANAFTSVHCLTMPAIMSSQEIPLLLDSIHRCLAPKGELLLNLIDAVPVAKSLGPRMREWFDQHLLLNLEKNFRCIHPCRLMPEWLAEAHLRGPGSNVKKVKFQAVYATDRGTPGLAVTSDGEVGGGGRNRRSSGMVMDGQSIGTRNELMTTVGRLLWQEVWGKFVHGDTWWWEDQGCVEECLGFGTYWEYWMIDSVKEERT